MSRSLSLKLVRHDVGRVDLVEAFAQRSAGVVQNKEEEIGVIRSALFAARMNSTRQFGVHDDERCSLSALTYEKCARSCHRR